jgi:RecB family exonuclease
MTDLSSITGKVRQQLHQSGLEMLSKCGIQFEFRYLKGMKRKPKSFLICGTATDAAVGTDLDCKIRTGELEQESVILDVARDVVAHHPERDNIEPEDEEKGKSNEQILGEVTDKAVRLVTAHHSEIAPLVRPSATHRKFSINMDAWLRKRAKEIHAAAEQMEVKGFQKIAHQQAAYLNAAARDGFDFVGEQDIVEAGDDQLVIRDVKTSKKSPSEDAAEKSNQLTAYAIASQVLDGKLPDAMKLDYLVDLKKSTKTMTLTTKRDDQQAMSYLNRIVNGIAAIRSGIFVPAPDQAWWCDERYCGFFNVCPHVKHSVTSIPQFVQIKEVDLNKEDR